MLHQRFCLVHKTCPRYVCNPSACSISVWIWGLHLNMQKLTHLKTMKWLCATAFGGSFFFQCNVPSMLILTLLFSLSVSLQESLHLNSTSVTSGGYENKPNNETNSSSFQSKCKWLTGMAGIVKGQLCGMNPDEYWYWTGIPKPRLLRAA